MANKEKFNKFLLTFLFIFLLTSISAITIYSGESIEIELDKQYEYYSIVGNLTPIEIEVVQHSNNNVTITIGKYSQEDSYEIVFFDKEKEIITVYSGGGGGGGGTRTIYKDKNVTTYVDREITKEVEVIKEVPGETIEIVNESQSQTKWIIALLIILVIALVVIAYFIFYRKDTNERGLNKNED